MLPGLACVCTLFFLAHVLFVALSPRIVEAVPPTPASAVNAWLRDWRLAQRDGLELPIATAGTLALLGAAMLLRQVRRWPRLLLAPAFQALSFGAAALVVLRSSTEELPGLRGGLSGWALAAGVASIVAGVWHGEKVPPRVRTAAAAAAALLAAGAVLLSLQDASLVDYGYFIAPALKLLQGERLGSFYVQYNLLGTAAFAAMLQAGLPVHQMQVLLALAFAGWLVLYHQLAKRLIGDRVLRWTFLLALVLVRFCLLHHHPTRLPQVNPFRLDLWVLLVLALRSWGFVSVRSAAAVALVYLADSLFGFMFLLLYLAFLVEEGVARARAGEPVPLARWAAVLLPAAVALLLTRAVFGSFIMPSAVHYAKVQLGFLPIDPRSLFWAIALALGAAAHLLRGEPDRRLLSFVVFVVAAELVYFFGRSHDHNLLNISGVWLFVIFLALDRIRARAAAVALTLFLAVAAGPRATLRLEAIASHLRRGVLVDPDPIEAIIAREQAWPRRDPRAVTLSMVDAYLNYRLGLRQLGRYTPFEANLFVDETSRWLQGLAASGHRLWSPNGEEVQGWKEESADVLGWVRAFNKSLASQDPAVRFEVQSEDATLEVRLAPATPAP